MGKTSKDFWDERSRKIGRKKKRRKTGRRYELAGGSSVTAQLPQNNWCNSDYVCTAPECFSFIYNLEESSKFFNDMLGFFGRGMPESRILIESKDVKKVTTDAIMYLIALMRNCRLSKERLYSFFGTYPEDVEAKQTYIESGLLKFVKSKAKQLPENTSKMSIMCGKNNDATAAGKICEFVMDKFHKEKEYTAELYEGIVEMMSNVYYHAYEEKGIMRPEWYMYAEYKQEEIQFLFLDTGLGIGKTIKKHSLYEKVVNKIGIGSEARLIKSALDGEFRTQTGKPNRGKGLPSINDLAHNNKIKDFHIISGGGHCWINENGVFECGDLSNKINGTIYCFVIRNLEVV